MTVTLTFASGFGKFDTEKTTGQPYEAVAGADIRRLVMNPPSVEKERGQWFIPSTYADHDARSHDVQRKNGNFRWLTLDIDSNDLPLADVDAAVDAVIGGCCRLIHSTRNATETNRKWRVLIPTANPIAGADFYDTQNAFFDLVEDASEGALIVDRALAGPAQLVYLPNRGEFYEYKADKAAMLDLTPDHAIMRSSSIGKQNGPHLLGQRRRPR